MNTSAPSDQISKYDELLLHRDKVASILKIVDRLVSDKAIDVTASGQPDIVSFVPRIAEKQGVLRFNCGGELYTLYGPLGGKSSKHQFHPKPPAPGSAKQHIVEPDEAPMPEPASTGRARRELTDEELAGGIDYRDLARKAIK